MNPLVEQVSARLRGNYFVTCDQCHAIMEVSQQEVDKRVQEVGPGGTLTISCGFCQHTLKEIRK